MNNMHRVGIIDSHTAGEPTRLVIGAALIKRPNQYRSNPVVQWRAQRFQGADRSGYTRQRGLLPAVTGRVP